MYQDWRNICRLLRRCFSAVAVIVAVKALNTAQSEMRLEAQAWISPKEGAILTNSGTSHLVQVFANHGRTPAESVKLSQYVVILPAETSSTQLVKILEENDNKETFSNIGPLPPGESFEVNAYPQLQRVHLGDSVLFFRVRVEYEDIFGKRHKTEDCSEVTSVPLESYPYGVQETTYGVCPTGKRMD